MKESHLAPNPSANKFSVQALIRQLWEQRFFHFVLVGVLNTAFSYMLFALFIYCGLHYKWAVLCSTILGILFNFKSTGTLVFKIKDNSLLFRFILSYSFIYLINVNVIKFFYFLTHNYYLSGALCSLLTPLLSFYLIKKFVFSGAKIETN